MSEIDDKAKKCPNCGSDQRSWFRKHPFLTVLLVLFLLGLIGSLSDTSDTEVNTTNRNASGNSSERTVTSRVNENEQVEKEPMEPEEIILADFIEEFDKNQLAAEDKYTGMFVQLEGYIGNISEDILGNYFVTLKPTNGEYYFGSTVQCFFEDKATLTSLENGQLVKLTGTVDSQDLGIIGINNCAVIE